MESRSHDPDATGPHTTVSGDLGGIDGRAEEEWVSALTKMCRDVLAPLVAADGGVMYLVKAQGDDVHVHLTGTCAGCPGAALTRDGVIAPAVRTVRAKARVVVTTGYRVPDGAIRIG